MVQYLDTKAMRCEEKLQRCAAEPVGNELEEALSIQSESATAQTLLRNTIQQQRADQDVQGGVKCSACKARHCYA